ncbi:GntR family transcriptional regulator [Thermoflavimicrobium dichotomicum]|uniref:GntR family transcriptional regulator n=1 Tax=Thermoflavimicrobium dichotomicum TaxID=46223 RepID=A0A1I3N9Z1_9BACL|nr:GntR family transcriptional regulator [Thermoflavimicrobium dichotomicum]SFJ06007.1 GntR family transcriptional regulator [Thermoflavimicrobium dichotomicum]
MVRNKWQDIYHQLRDRILRGELKPGQAFPTNFELMKEFNAHAATVQNAVNALIREGLVYSAENTTKKRTVRHLPYRVKRSGDFIKEHGDSGKEITLQLKILQETEELPEVIQKEMQPPILFYHTRQTRDDMVIAVTRSYFPNLLPLERLKSRLSKPDAMIYSSLKSLGYHPTDCEETLVSSLASPSDIDELQMPKNANIPVVRITRKVYDYRGRLLQICLMVDRADCYTFQYRFSL